MKRAVCLLLAALLLCSLTACQSTEPPSEEPPTEISPVDQQRITLSSMGFTWGDPIVEALAVFPEDMTWTGQDYSFTVEAMVLDYYTKYMRITVKPVSEKAKATFDEFDGFPSYSTVEDPLSPLIQGMGGGETSSIGSQSKTYDMNFRTASKTIALFLPKSDTSMEPDGSLNIDVTSPLSAPLDIPCQYTQAETGISLDRVIFCATSIDFFGSYSNADPSIEYNPNSQEFLSSYLQENWSISVCYADGKETPVWGKSSPGSSGGFNYGDVDPATNTIPYSCYQILSEGIDLDAVTLLRVNGTDIPVSKN